MPAYYAMTPEDILNDIKKNLKTKFIKILGIELQVFPNVYPPDKFRTTEFLIQSIKSLVKDQVVCDMGCGTGIIGLQALLHNAKKVVFADINKDAIENTKVNIINNNIINNKSEVYCSDCFDAIPTQQFDLIVFNIPFHSDPVKISASIDLALYDPGFKNVNKFLRQSKKFMNDQCSIIIPFSNKGDYQSLETLFLKNGFDAVLWKTINTNAVCDNRIYQLTLKK